MNIYSIMKGDELFTELYILMRLVRKNDILYWEHNVYSDVSVSSKSHMLYLAEKNGKHIVCEITSRDRVDLSGICDTGWKISKVQNTLYPYFATDIGNSISDI